MKSIFDWCRKIFIPCGCFRLAFVAAKAVHFFSLQFESGTSCALVIGWQLAGLWNASEIETGRKAQSVHQTCALAVLTPYCGRPTRATRPHSGATRLQAFDLISFVWPCRPATSWLVWKGNGYTCNAFTFLFIYFVSFIYVFAVNVGNEQFRVRLRAEWRGHEYASGRGKYINLLFVRVCCLLTLIYYLRGCVVCLH